ncbi:MAG: SDR family oxidoreductase [Myxococcales bacterium]|nr:SDR family oxidoreductase [Myxococcales bacterium]
MGSVSNEISDLVGQLALVTGASGGIGQAVARQLAKLGARVAIHYRSNEQDARKTVAALSGDGHFLVKGDLSDPREAQEVITLCESEGINILVNNAGIFEPHSPKSCSYNEWIYAWDRHLRINLVGPALLSFLVARSMVEGGRGGRIINIGSRGAYRGEPENPAYGASKAGLHSLTQSLAQAFAGNNIGIFAVAPGFVETAMTAALLDSPKGVRIRSESCAGRVAKPEEVAYWVGCLALSEAFFATGTIIDVNGASYLR